MHPSWSSVCANISSYSVRIARSSLFCSFVKSSSLMLKVGASGSFVWFSLTVFKVDTIASRGRGVMFNNSRFSGKNIAKDVGFMMRQGIIGEVPKEMLEAIAMLYWLATS